MELQQEDERSESKGYSPRLGAKAIPHQLEHLEEEAEHDGVLAAEGAHEDAKDQLCSHGQDPHRRDEHCHHDHTEAHHLHTEPAPSPVSS